MNFTPHILRFSDLNGEQVYQLMQLRQEVFIVEQYCPYLDADGKDSDCFHLFITDQEHEVLAYARLVPPGISYQNHVSIGRILTAPAARGRKIGNALMDAAIDWLAEQYPDHTVKIGAQLYLKGFYERFGFRQIAPPYNEDAIPHIEMVRTAG